MKQILISILLFAFAYTGQSQIAEVATDIFLDSISTSSSADTVTRTLNLNSKNRQLSQTIWVTADSLSGGTTGTLVIQHSLDAGTTWRTLYTLTIDGVQTTNAVTGYTFDIMGGRLRAYTLAASSTQLTQIKIWYSWRYKDWVWKQKDYLKT